MSRLILPRLVSKVIFRSLFCEQTSILAERCDRMKQPDWTAVFVKAARQLVETVRTQAELENLEWTRLPLLLQSPWTSCPSELPLTTAQSPRPGSRQHPSSAHPT